MHYCKRAVTEKEEEKEEEEKKEMRLLASEAECVQRLLYDREPACN